MRSLMPFVLVMLVASCTTRTMESAADEDVLYGCRILIATQAGANLKACVEDAASALGRMTGKPFSAVTNDVPEAIALYRTKDPGAPADAAAKLLGAGREPFLIRSMPGRLILVANRDEGLIHGLYYYLEQLGARFYFPNENWTILPKRSSVAVAIDTVVTPDYRVRSFFGSGGFGRLSYDRDGRAAKRWDLWKRRNRFGGEFTLGGHSGESFNLANKDMLLEHPEYLAKVNGQHGPWSLIAKLNPSNTNAVNRYVKWSVDRFRQARAKDSEGPSAFAVSVDPSDGGGHCTCDECRRIGDGSASDLVFHIANQVARAVTAEFPGAWVNLYGYNEHARPPSIDLETNVYVSIIPYAFQTTGMTPEEFIRAWGRKVKRMGIYDYWSIPDWSADLPSFNYLRTPAEKLRFWHANRISEYTAESTFSAGAMGIGWYVGSRLMWDLETDPAPILAEFYRLSFGAAAPPMQRMLERWARGFLLYSQELALSHRDMQEAIRLADRPDVRERLADYGRYLHYLRLRFEWLQAPATEKQAARDALARWLWGIYDTGMVHSFRLFQLLARGQQDLLDAFAYENLEAPGWKTVIVPDDAAVFRLMDEGATRYTPRDFVVRQFNGPLVAVPTGAVEVVRLATNQVPAEFAEGHFLGNTDFELEAVSGQTNLMLSVKPDSPARVQLLNPEGVVLHELKREASKEWETIAIPIPGPGFHRLRLMNPKNSHFNVRIPRGVRLSMLPFRTSKVHRSPRRLYFYVPPGLKTIAVYHNVSLPWNLQFFAPDGTEVKPQVLDNSQLFLAEVPPGTDGKVWGIANVTAPNHAVTALNVPSYYAFYPDTLLVPQDALQPAPGKPR